MTPDLNKDIKTLLEKQAPLTALEQNSLKKYISEGYARLNNHFKTGQNFL